MAKSTDPCAPRRRALLPPPALAAAVSIIMLAVVVSPAVAQTGAARGGLSVNGGLQTATSGFSDSVHFGHGLFGPEQGTLDTRYPGSDDALFDVGGSVRVWRNLAVGASVSWLTRETDADVAGQLPHPFWFDRPRSVSGTAAGLARTETAVHVQALWVIPVGRSVAVTLFGGPTWFNASQDLVSDITFDQAYPFDAATYSGANTGERSASTIGAHAGADVAYYFSDRIGVGGMVRFSRGSVELDSPDGGTAVSDVGGVDTSGGLRIRF
ncbi:MAG: outer membrane beta-barrel protein [Acidobacteria bacterium]|nr:outer membrane beta-barrel protein [Acidobacteriota bacterium]